MNYYSFHIGDYRGATAHLTNDEDLCYRRLLDLYYDKDGIMPDLPAISRRVRFSIELVESILNEFFTLQESNWIHARAQCEIDLFKEKSEVAKRSAEKRWCKGNANAMPTQCEGNANQEPITNNQYIPPTPKGDEVKDRKEKAPEQMSEAFLAFWQSYPRKTGKRVAWKAWKNINRPQLEVILDAIRKARQSPDWLKERGAFIPHPSTWLNQARWEDEGMDYAALAGKRVLGASSSQETAFQIDEQDALRWVAERYEQKAGIPYREWPTHVQAEYRSQLKQLQAA